MSVPSGNQQRQLRVFPMLLNDAFCRYDGLIMCLTISHLSVVDANFCNYVFITPDVKWKILSSDR